MKKKIECMFYSLENLRTYRNLSMKNLNKEGETPTLHMHTATYIETDTEIYRFSVINKETRYNGARVDEVVLDLELPLWSLTLALQMVNHSMHKIFILHGEEDLI